MTPPQVQWGTITLYLDNEAFRQGFLSARHWYFASYKASLSGSQAIKVDADYTSKRCPMCGHTADGNRPKKGLLFVCQQCHYTLHADLIGARNVTLRTLVLQQDWSATGQLSVAPDASDKEAKAARLRRYAELRWSPDGSSQL